MTVVQCWDDGVSSDVRVADILRKHGARASFNLNAGLHQAKRASSWRYKDTDVQRLGWDEMKDVYDGFTIANHSLTHPSLTKIPLDQARREVAEGRERLQQFFGQPVTGFVYPNGVYNNEVMAVIREAGHVYARTAQNIEHPFPPEDAMAFHPCCHFLAGDFWSRYEKAKAGGVFYFWGHSYEIISESMWAAFEQTIARITSDGDARWGEVADLFGSSVSE